MNELKNISYEVGEVVTPLKSASIYAKDKKFSDLELTEKADGLRQVSALAEVTNFEIAFRLLAVKEHAKSAEQLGRYIGKEKADIYEFSKVVTGKSKGRTSEYIKVAETFRARTDNSKYIPDKEKYYLDETVGKFNFDTLLLVAKSKDLPMLSDKYEFLKALNDGITALEVKEKLRDLNDEEPENEENEDTASEDTASEDTASEDTASEDTAKMENVSRETILWEDLPKSLQDRIRSYCVKNVGEKIDELVIANVVL